MSKKKTKSREDKEENECLGLVGKDMRHIHLMDKCLQVKGLLQCFMFVIDTYVFQDCKKPHYHLFHVMCDKLDEMEKQLDALETKEKRGKSNEMHSDQ